MQIMEQIHEERRADRSPRKPYVITNKYTRSVSCISDGDPKPVIEWFSCSATDERCGTYSSPSNEDLHRIQKEELDLREGNLLSDPRNMSLDGRLNLDTFWIKNKYAFASSVEHSNGGHYTCYSEELAVNQSIFVKVLGKLYVIQDMSVLTYACLWYYFQHENV
ncbi:hypothetical protein JD844_033173 [Phrynosoma platyrhinos]|uniref:Ig-like domain-containing protein n=1 Tax=Phrynosoma platyrhinos TaxID=52577 RepID=A0ABQ7T673_PHRPL|nr:hypothetical protein JD844_033173 [Phrynosoma platyrhinos]